MTTLYSSWVGGGVQGRIRCDYTVTYSADHTQAIYNGTLYVEFDQSIYDNVNSWSVGGDDGAHSGSNLAISFGSGGGLKAVYTFSFQKYGDGALSISVNNVEGVGATISGSFTLDSGALAPYWLDGSYGASSITTTTAYISGYAAHANGGTMANVQAEYNTAPNDTGAQFYSPGAYQNMTLTGLTPNTLYYVRVRFSNSTYGWGSWGGWASFRTLSTVPSAIATTWSFINVGKTDATATGISVPDNGGATVDQIQTWVSTDSAFGTYTEINSGNVTQVYIGSRSPVTTYYVKIRAHNANGYGAWSSTKSFTTLSTIPDPPTTAWTTANVTQVAFDVQNIVAGWNGGATIDFYRIRISTSSSFTTYWDVTTTTSSKNIPNLVPGTTYYVKIAAHNANGYSADTAAKLVTTLPGVSVNVGGVWKNAVPYVNVNGVWKPAVRYVNVGGTWKQ